MLGKHGSLTETSETTHELRPPLYVCVAPMGPYIPA
jgi:hypothetical protein